MTTHILMPEIMLHEGLAHPVYEQYLKGWRESAIKMADAGETAASICLQGTFVDFVLFGKPGHDWLGIMDALLMDGDTPLAYSARLFNGSFPPA
jgi:hypothetical protein